MKKIALTLAAIAALSTAGFAGSKRTADLRDLQPAYSANVTTETAPFAVEEGVSSAYDRMIENVTQHNQGDR